MQRDELTLRALFNEELGALVQVRADERDAVLAVLREGGLSRCSHVIGKPQRERDTVEVWRDAKCVYATRAPSCCRRSGARPATGMAALRDNPECAEEEFERIATADDRGLSLRARLRSGRGRRRAVHRHAARGRGWRSCASRASTATWRWRAAFDRAGLRRLRRAHDRPVRADAIALADFRGLVACGGFSYGDVLGAGAGWARSVLFNARLAEQFAAFFARRRQLQPGRVQRLPDDLAVLKAVIPGAEHWPRFLRNRSEQFEARFSLVEVLESPSIFFAGMAGSRMPIAVAHGEGRVAFDSDAQRAGGGSGDALRRERRQRRERLSGQPERLARRAHRRSPPPMGARPS